MAWLRPIRRGLGAVLADLEPFLGLEPRPSTQTSPVHRALLALGHGSLSLPAAATFTRLPLAGADVPLTARASSTWKSHLVLSVPRPSGRAATASSSSAGSRSHVPLHRLRLHEHEAAPLNAELARLASRLAWSQPGVDKTNYGGWQVPRHRTRAPPLSARSQPGTASRSAWHFSSGRQSADELFEGSPSACCAKLQAIASGALDEAQLHHVQTGALKAEAAEAGEAAAAAEEEEGEAAEAKGRARGARSCHASHAWLNINRRGDSNEMHVHAPRRWSAVYFVAGLPGGAAPAAVAATAAVAWLATAAIAATAVAAPAAAHQPPHIRTAAYYLWPYQVGPTQSQRQVPAAAAVAAAAARRRAARRRAGRRRTWAATCSSVRAACEGRRTPSSPCRPSRAPCGSSQAASRTASCHSATAARRTPEGRARRAQIAEIAMEIASRSRSTSRRPHPLSL